MLQTSYGLKGLFESSNRFSGSVISSAGQSKVSCQRQKSWQECWVSYEGERGERGREQAIYLSTYLSMYPSIHPSIHLSVYLVYV